MTDFVLEYGDGPRESSVATVEELDALLDRIIAEATDRGRPELPTLYDEDGRSLAMGVGDRLAILSWTDENNEDDVVLSQGDEPGSGEVKFFYGNQFSFFPASARVPVTVAREAMRQFMTTGSRPTAVRWQEP